MRILVTNDDGLDAAGLGALEGVATALGDVSVIAPHQERSGAGHSLTMHAPLRVDPRGDKRWACSGTPVDCVYLAIHSLCDGMPELTLSGINKGANLGDDVFYSGTVGAAREAALNGIPALAVSLHTAGSDTTFHYEAAAEFALMVAKQMIEHPLPHGVLLNLNVPNLPLNQINGLEICRLGRRHYEPMVEARIDPRNKAYYWIGGSPLGELMGEGTDGYWIAQGFATLTPLGLDNTHTGFLSNLEGWTLNPRKRSEHE